MKKISIVFVIVIMAICSKAAQVNWGASGQLYYGTTPMTPAAGYSVTAYLVYLGENATWDSGFSVTSSSSISVGGDVLKSANLNAFGQIAPTGGTALTALTDGVTKIGTDNDTFAYDVSTFGIIFIAKHTSWEEGEFAWLISDAYVFTTTPSQVGASWDGAKTTFEISTKVTNSPATWNFVPVPEPATVGFALAGLALLFRRKRK